MLEVVLSLYTSQKCSERVLREGFRMFFIDFDCLFKGLLGIRSDF